MSIVLPVLEIVVKNEQTQYAFWENYPFPGCAEKDALYHHERGFWSLIAWLLPSGILLLLPRLRFLGYP